MVLKLSLRIDITALLSIQLAQIPLSILPIYWNIYGTTGYKNGVGPPWGPPWTPMGLPPMGGLWVMHGAGAYLGLTRAIGVSI